MTFNKVLKKGVTDMEFYEWFERETGFKPTFDPYSQEDATLMRKAYHDGLAIGYQNGYREGVSSGILIGKGSRQ